MATLGNPSQVALETVSDISLTWKVIYLMLTVWIAATIFWDPGLFASQFIGGFVFGMILVMIALGLTLIFGLMGVINFAHGSLFMIGGYLTYAVIGQYGGSFWLALVVAPVGVGLLGLMIERTLIRRLYGSDPLSIVMVTFGLVMMFNEAVRFLWGSSPRTYTLPPILSQEIDLSVTSVPALRVFTVAVGILLVGLSYLLIVRTDFGLTIRAGVQDAEMTEIVGVNLLLRFTVMFAIGSAMAGLAGVLRGGMVGVTLAMADEYIVLVFVVIVVGGMGSFGGSVVAGLLIGWTRFLVPQMMTALAGYTAIGALNVGGGIGNVLPYVLMAIVLLVRPQGLFGREGMFE
jgi:branched-subunit amino acid ABC-type transport system permease component